MTGRPGEARADVGGVRLAVRAGDERGWLSRVCGVLMPVEAQFQNESGAAIRIRPEQFVLVLPSGVRKPAMQPEDVIFALRNVAPLGPQPSLRNVVPIPRRPVALSPLAVLYSWPGLHGQGSLYRIEDPGPDPRPRPEGVLTSGDHGSAVLFFDVPADGVKAFDLEVAIEGEGGEIIGTANVPYTRS